MQRHKVIHWTRAKTCFCFFVNFRPIQWLMVKCQITFFEVSLLYDISSDLKKVLWVFLRAQNKKKLVRLSKDGATEAAAPKPFPQSLHFTWRWKSWSRQAMIFLNFDFCQKRSLEDFFFTRNRRHCWFLCFVHSFLAEMVSQNENKTVKILVSASLLWP